MSAAVLIFALIFNFCFAQNSTTVNADEVENQAGDKKLKTNTPLPPVGDQPTQTSSAPIPIPPSGSTSEPLPPPEQDKNTNSQTIELIDEGKSENLNSMDSSQQSSQSLTWDPTGKRDPFKPYRAPRAVRQNSDVVVDPLTLLDLSQVQVVAILWNNKIPRAVIRGEGKLFTIFKRTNIGPNNGIVAEIREGEVIVVETFDDGFGNIVKEVRPLRLSKPNAQPGSASSGS